MQSFCRSTTVILTLLFLAASVVSAQKLNPDEIVPKHLESLDAAEARAAVKSVTAVGDAETG